MAHVVGTSSSDTLKGTSGSDLIEGLGGNDTISAGGGNDTIIGGTGNDTLTGGTGADIFRYNAREFGQDTITDFKSNDKIDLAKLNVADLATLRPYMTDTADGVKITLGFDGSAETILLSGISIDDLSSSNFVFNTSTKALSVTGNDYVRDVLFGGKGNDTLKGMSGNDDLNGGAGNDILIGGTGNDTLRGGAGNDIFRYDAREFGADTILDFTKGDRLDVSKLNIAGITSLAPYMQNTADGVKITLGFDGSTETILISGKTIDELASSDFIFNSSTTDLTVAGNDYVRDVLFGGKGNDTLRGLSGNDDLNGSNGNDILIGGTGDDVLRGGKDNDIFRYDAREFGNDTIMDFAKGDRIDVSKLNIAGIASLSPYMQNTADGVKITLGFDGSSETILIRGVTTDQLKSSDFIFNSSTTDLTVTGNDYVRDVLFGGKGNDTLRGLSGNDDLNGSNGNDILIGGRGNDLLRGGSGNDIFRYDAREFGNDTVTDFASGDRLDFSLLNVADLATLKPYMQNSADGVKITLGFAGSSESVLLQGATISQLTSDNFIFNTSSTGLTVTGNDYVRDVLFGGKGNDILRGLSGEDELNGGAGNDTLIGGGGADILRGGAGNDIFRFDSVSSSDTVVDFTRGSDKIQLDNSVYTALNEGALPAGEFRNGTYATDATDHLIYDRSTGRLWYDADGNGSGDMVQIATFTNKPALTASDFTVI